MIFQFVLIIIFLVNNVVSLECTSSSPPDCRYNSTCSFVRRTCDSSSVSNVRGGMYCSTIIKNLDELIIGSMDCMYDQEVKKNCKNQSECILNYINKDSPYLHCCCHKDYCNFNFTLNSSPTGLSTNESCETNQCKSSELKGIYIILLCSIIGFIFILIFLCFINRNILIRALNKFRRYFIKPSNSRLVQTDLEQPKERLLQEDLYQINFKDLTFDKILKKGRFSIIQQGTYQDKKVAIKILSDINQNGEAKCLFENEKQIYSSPPLIHDNILKYYGYSINNSNYMIISELSSYGSLRDVIRNRLLEDENELKQILKDISNGLEYLHCDSRKEVNGRCPIAHRDLKSENILYLNSTRIVICDFAMSLRLDHNQNNPNEQQQIGTARYMSPEMLAGTIGCETNSLLKCDVYALGIIFWEVLSRSTIQDKNEIYEMAFEKQLNENHLNLNPRVDEMYKIINLKSPLNRPLIKLSWRNTNNKIFNEIISTMEQCWDQNPEGRISSALVAHRLRQL